MKRSYSTAGMPGAFQGGGIGSAILFLLFLLIIPLRLSALDYYWVGGGGNWSEHDTHWATTSGGGVFHSQVPTSMDNVFFDANSFPAGGTVTIDQTIIYCMDMDWTGAASGAVLSGPVDKMIFIYGSLTLIPDMVWNVQGEMHFLAFQPGQTITSNGHSFLSTVYFEGIGGEWTMQDAFETESSVYHQEGIFRSNNNPLKIGSHWNFINGSAIYGSPELYLGSSLMEFKNYSQTYFSVYGPSVLDADASHIVYDIGGELTDSQHDFLDITFKAGPFNTTVASGCNVLGKLVFEDIGQYTGSGNYVHSAVFGESGGFNAMNTEADSLVFNGNGTIRGNDIAAHNVVFKGPGGINQIAGNTLCENYGSNHQFGRVVFEDNGWLFGNNSYDSLVLTPGNIYYLESGRIQTINPDGHFVSSGSDCDNFVTLLSCNSGGPKAKISKNPPDITLEYVTVRGISIVGGAIFNAENSVDLGKNVGWTFTPLLSRNLYWVGGGGEWMDKNHWSLNSGGAGGQCIPTAYDDVFFDAASGFSPNDTVSLNQDILYCRDMDWSGVANSPTMWNAGQELLAVYGSLTFAPDMNDQFTGYWRFRATTPGQTITSNGHSFLSTVYFEGLGGEWTMQDAFETESSVYHQEGILRSNNNPLKIGSHWNFINGSETFGTPELYLGSSLMEFKNYSQTYFSVYGPSALDADASHIVYDIGGELTDSQHDFLDITFKAGPFNTTVASGCNVLGKILFEDIGQYTGNGNYLHSAVFGETGGFNAMNTEVDSLVFNGNGTIRGNDIAAHDVVFKGPGGINQVAGNSLCENYGSNHQFGRVVFEDNGWLFGDNSYDSLVLSPGHIYYLESGRVQTINPDGHFISSGSDCDNFVTLLSCNSGGPKAKISKSPPDLTLEYVTVRGISIQGGAIFNAVNSVDLGKNVGWIFSPLLSRDLYWVGGGGEWMDKNHWSLNSGGAGGQCLPTAYDDVFFDAASGFSPNDTVSLNQDILYCRDMDWSGVTNSPTLWNAGQQILAVYGSLTFAPDMDDQFTGQWRFRATTPGQTITSNGHSFLSTVYFEGIGGEWIMQDAFETESSVYHQEGILRSNNNPLKIGSHWNFINGSETFGTPELYLGTSLMEFKNYSQTYFSVYGPSALDADESHIVYDIGGELTDSQHDFLDITFKAGPFNTTVASGCNVLGKILFEDIGQYTGNGNYVHSAVFVESGGFNAMNTEVDSLVFNGNGAIRGNNIEAHDVVFKGPGGINQFAGNSLCENYGSNHQFGRVVFEDNGWLSGDNSYDSLVFTQGKTYILESNHTQTIAALGDFIANGIGGFPIEIKSCQLGSQATIHKDGAPICLDYLYLTDMAANGTGLSYVGANSDDVFNNSGWIFEACPACISAPLPAPVLDPASVTTVMPGEMATLILQNLLPGYEAVWFDSLQTTEVYAGTGNLFQPVINGPSTFYGAFREIATGCISGVLAVFPSTYTGTLISGKILFENDDVTGVNNVTVNLTGAAASTALTNVNGDYSMTVNTTGSFTLKGVKQINRLNGVTVGDVSRIQQHVIGNFPITDPYKLIAADINGNEQVSSQDVTLLQQAILNNPGALAVFSTFWRFIDASVSLNLPPWSQIPAAEQINLMGASGNQSGKNFTGIKVGDVASPSANPANRPTVISPLIWTLQDQDLVAGHVTATFQVAQFQDLAAYQFALAFDPTRLKFEGWQAGAALPLNTSNFGFTESESGVIRTAFAQPEGSTVAPGQLAFTLTFKVLKGGGKLSEALGIDTYWMPAVAYTSDLQPQVVVMNFEGTSTGINNPAAANEGLQLFQNQPNPFTNETLISFRLPEAGEARLRIFDVSGRLLAESVCDCADGYHEERFDLAGGATGILSYELATPFGVITKKMVRTP